MLTLAGLKLHLPASESSTVKAEKRIKKRILPNVLFLGFAKIDRNEDKITRQLENCVQQGW